MSTIRETLINVGLTVAPGAIQGFRRYKKVRKRIQQARDLRRNYDTIDAFVDAEELQHGSLFFASQRKAEILGLLRLLEAIQPRMICEIGAYRGGTLFLFSQVARPDATIVSVDIDYARVEPRVLRELMQPTQKLHCVEADSHQQSTVNKLQQILQGKKLDFLFIDGDHSYDGVKADFELYSPLVKHGGLIALHDIHPDYRMTKGIPTKADVGEVPHFWANIKDKYVTRELIANPDQDGMGIGVIEW